MAATSVARPPVILADDQPGTLLVVRDLRVAWRLPDCVMPFTVIGLIAAAAGSPIGDDGKRKNHRRINYRYR